VPLTSAAALIFCLPPKTSVHTRAKSIAWPAASAQGSSVSSAMVFFNIKNKERKLLWCCTFIHHWYVTTLRKKIRKKKSPTVLFLWWYEIWTGYRNSLPRLFKKYFHSKMYVLFIYLLLGSFSYWGLGSRVPNELGLMLSTSFLIESWWRFGERVLSMCIGHLHVAHLVGMPHMYEAALSLHPPCNHCAVASIMQRTRLLRKGMCNQ